MKGLLSPNKMPVFRKITTDFVTCFMQHQGPGTQTRNCWNAGAEIWSHLFPIHSHSSPLFYEIVKFVSVLHFYGECSPFFWRHSCFVCLGDLCAPGLLGYPIILFQRLSTTWEKPNTWIVNHFTHTILPLYLSISS